MQSFISILVLAASTCSVAAFDRISVASDSVQAGQPFDVTFTNDLGTSNSFDAGFDSFRVYLAITVPGWGSGPSCYLVNSTDITTTKVSVTIPASVGEDADTYMISTMEFNQDPNKDGPSGFDYSSAFSLSGATATWSKIELAGYTIGNADYVPCTAYDCARQCAEKHDASELAGEGATAGKAWDDIAKCTSACPGVTFPSDIYDDDTGSSGIADSSVSALLSSASASRSTTSTTPTSSATASASATSGSSHSSAGLASASSSLSSPAPTTSKQEKSSGVRNGPSLLCITIVAALAYLSG